MQNCHIIILYQVTPSKLTKLIQAHGERSGIQPLINIKLYFKNQHLHNFGKICVVICK